MARVPLVHMSAARHGVAGAVPLALRELSHRLRHDPTPGECAEAARIIDRLANIGARGWAAAGLKPAGRPRGSGRVDPVGVWHEVEMLRIGVTLTAPRLSVAEARKRVAAKYGLSVSRVKAVHLEYERAKADAQADW